MVPLKSSWRKWSNKPTKLGFVIPLGAKPTQCANDITPHGMKSSTTCALSGAFLLAGGWCGVMWVFMRALALHLQICWQVVIGKSCKLHHNQREWQRFLTKGDTSHVGGLHWRLGPSCCCPCYCYDIQWGFFSLWRYAQHTFFSSILLQ